MNLDSDVSYRKNKATRKRIEMWVQEFEKYQVFLDGCSILLYYYDTEDLLKSDYWVLVELHARWSSVINTSFYYGNRYQIENFVPFAQKRVSELVSEMLKRKKLLKSTQVERPKNGKLDKEIVRSKVDHMKIIGNYLDGIQEVTSGKFKAKAICKWHTDKDPSMMIDKNHGLHCFVCGANFMDIYALIMEREQCDFATAVSRAMEIGV